MLIAAVTATPVNIPLRAPYRFAYGSTAALTKTIVEVTTDDGATGIGEAADGDRSADVLRLGARLVGLDPLDLNEAERRCVPAMSYAPWDNLVGLRRAFAGVEMALWDLRGRIEGRPLHALLGGAVRRRIPLTEYFAFRAAGPDEPGEATAVEIARYCARMVEQHGAWGFEGKLGTVDLAEEVAMVREVRAAIGAERPLRLDANGRFTVTTALDMWRRIEPYGVCHWEDPVDTLEELARLRPQLGCTVSTHQPDLRRAVALGVPDVFVCNIAELGGIRRTVEFVQACELMRVGFWFHSGETGVATAAYLQLSAALEPVRAASQTLVRWMADDVIAGGPFVPEGGGLDVPDGPGLGVELDRAALERCHRRYLEDGPFPSAGHSGGGYGAGFRRL